MASGAIRTGDVGWANRSNRIQVVDYLKREFDGRITHAIVLDNGVMKKNGEDNFLFRQTGRYESMKQVISPFFFDVIGAERAHLSGESLGGWVASRAAVDHPDRIDRLVLNTAGGSQRVAVAAGLSMLAWPTKPVHAKIVVLGLDSAAPKL